MAWRLAGSLVTLRNEINNAYPNRSKVSDGALGDAAHSARVSDHNPDAGGVVRAIDVTQDDPFHTSTPSDDVAEAVAEFLRAKRDPRTKYVIWRGRMFSSYATRTRKAWEWGPYTGPNGHFHHVHISVQPGGQGDDHRPWGFTRPGNHPPITRKWMPFGPSFTTDQAITSKGGELVEVTEVQMILTALAADWHAPDLDPGPIDGQYGTRSQAAVSAFKRRMIVLQHATKQLPWPDTKPSVNGNVIAALRFWNANR